MYPKIRIQVTWERFMNPGRDLQMNWDLRKVEGSRTAGGYSKSSLKDKDKLT